MQDRRHGALVQGAGWGEIAPPPHLPFDADEARHVIARLDLAGPHEVPVTMPARIRCGIVSASYADSISAGLAQELGLSVRRQVRVNALITGATAEEVRMEARQAMDAGHDTFKLKIGTKQDLVRAEALRDTVGARAIRLDANGAWDGPTARWMLDALSAIDFEYIEQPVPPEMEAELRSLASSHPIALDEASTDPEEIGRRVRDGQGDVIIIKPQRLGGPDLAAAAILAATDAGATPVITNSLETSVGVHVALHVASLLPKDVACGLATGSYLARDVGPGPRFEAGRMTVPKEGLGVEPDLSMLEDE